MAALDHQFQAGRYKVQLTGGPNAQSITDLGFTTEGINLTLTENIQWFGTDYSGGTEYEGIVSGGSGTLSFELASTVEISDMLVAGDQAGGNVDFAVRCGALASASSYVVTLTKQTGNNQILTFTAGVAKIEGDIQQIVANALLTVPLTFRLLPDATGKLIVASKT